MTAGNERYRYVIGDIQGCAQQFDALLAACDFDPACDRLWIAGDMVNRGPDNLSVVRKLMALGSRAQCVMGNHDFYFLALAAGILQPKPEDTVQDLLDAPDCAQIVDWMRRLPLLHVEDGMAMAHAGLLPQWTIPRALELAAEVERELGGSNWKEFLRTVWGGRPVCWCDDLTGPDRLRIIVNAMCRLRFLRPDGAIELKPTDSPEARPDLLPWFQADDACWRTHQLFHGHWSALGFRDMGQVVALDSGCVWGGALTAFRMEDRRVFSVGGQRTDPPCATNAG